MNLFRLKDCNYTNQKFNGSALLLVMLVLVYFAISPMAEAVVPAPDGGYPGGNTAEGQTALLSLTTGGFNTAVGFLSLRSNTTNSFNTAVGAGTLLANVADNNTATGAGALLSNTTGEGNTASGASALFSNTQGIYNSATGIRALFSNTTGSFNIAVGQFAGSGVTTANGVICIGAAGQNVSGTCFIGNIRGVTTFNNNAIPVLVDSIGQLGTVSSSRRYKKEIKQIEKASEAILALKPVTFHYKSDGTNRPEFGLIAEEVAEINPDLVVRDENGEIYTVRYDAVNAMLLNEFLKEHRKVEKLEVTVAALAARLERVSAQVQINDSAAQVAANNH